MQFGSFFNSINAELNFFFLYKSLIDVPTLKLFVQFFVFLEFHHVVVVLR